MAQEVAVAPILAKRRSNPLGDAGPAPTWPPCAMIDSKVPVVISEKELSAFLDRYPSLSRTQVLTTIALKGPERRRVEKALAAMA